MNAYHPDTYTTNVKHRHYWGMNRLHRVNAVCSDGMVRRATVTGEPDTYFSVPARVTVRGRTVTGFLTCDRNVANDDVYSFNAYRYLKNAYLLPDAIVEV